MVKFMGKLTSFLSHVEPGYWKLGKLIDEVEHPPRRLIPTNGPATITSKHNIPALLQPSFVQIMSITPVGVFISHDAMRFNQFHVTQTLG